jgi:hypothetical protein|tara:strand:+ start:108 stop:347 length:240 start_codon:yes stop_codon:yes gene_type:complete
MIGVIEIAVIAGFEPVTDAIPAEPNRTRCECGAGEVDEHIGGVRAAQVGAVIVIHSVTVVTGLHSNGKHSITAVRAQRV